MSLYLKKLVILAQPDPAKMVPLVSQISTSFKMLLICKVLVSYLCLLSMQRFLTVPVPLALLELCVSMILMNA